MTQQYPQLTYPGDVTGSDQTVPGHLLGCDEVGRFYEVIDAEFVPEGTGHCICGRTHSHTHVNLQYATAETLQAAAGRGAGR